MLKKLKVSTQQTHNWKIKYERTQKIVKKLKQKLKITVSLQSEVDKLNINENEKIFCKILIKQNRGTNARWHDCEKKFAQSIYYRSTSTYLFLRDILKLNLPSPSSLSRWSDIKNLQPGITPAYIMCFKRQFPR